MKNANTTNQVVIKKDGKEYIGTPYIDFKTFKGWQSAGFKVKKGSKSVYSSVSFPRTKDKDGTEKSFPKVYYLFHFSQVEPITKR
jgi:hypothetical protein